MIQFSRSRLLSLLVVMSLVVAGRVAAQPEDSLMLENLGQNVNSPYNDVGPVISPDGKTLYFDRTDHPQNIGNDDIWFSTRKADGTWSPAQNMGAPLNNQDHNFVSTVTPDGNTLLLGNVYFDNGTMGPGVSISHRGRNGWDRPQKLNIRNYYSHGLSANYYLGNDGKTLLLAIERDDTHGDLDLYVSFLSADGSWTEPRNLGPDVNTVGADRTPFLAADGVSLYFASDGHGGLGSSDIFVARRLDSTWQHWSTPENLGAPINTEGWDGFFTIPASGEYAYLVSSKNSFGEADIFRVKVPDRMRPHPVALVSGHVYDAKTKKPIASQITYTAGRSGGNGTNGNGRTDPATGSYRLTLPAGKRYALTASADGYSSSDATIDLGDVNAYKETTHDFYLTPNKRQETPHDFGPILFASGSADLSAEARAQLDRVIASAQENGSAQFSLTGHTDNIGAAEANDDLGMRRAKAAAEYLTAHGIDAGRISAQSSGERNPIASNDTEAGRGRNRRVEVHIAAESN